MNTIKLTKLSVLWLSVFATAATFCPESATAQGLMRAFGRRSEKQVDLKLTKTDGPWLIMCASFDGQDGQEQAIRLANELRKSHGLKSYIHKQFFNFQEKVADLGLGYQKPTAAGNGNVRSREMKLANTREKMEYAVLVGDFDSIESAKAQKSLALIKKLKPVSLELHSANVQDSSQSGARIRAKSEAMFDSGGTYARMNNNAFKSEFPLRTALLVTNPMLPPEFFAATKIDRYIVGLNRGLKFSLLDNPKMYTLKVASFAGQSVIKPGDIEKMTSDRAWLDRNLKGKNNTGLVEAAKRARILTEYLRSQGVEAYQFHDRHESFVCVGSFDWVSKGDRRSSTPNPEVVKLARKFQAKPTRERGQITTYPLPARLLEAGVTCDANPATVIVPSATVRTAEAIEASRR
jgi:hypothetical protein